MEVDVVAMAVPAAAPAPATAQQQLTQQEVLCLFQHVIKLASENKITEQNAWDIAFIDHMPGLIKEQDALSLNFQSASCGLDAGVTVYSKRVEATYKLANSTLTGLANQQPDGGQEGSAPQGGGPTRSRGGGECESTLETSPEALEAKEANNVSLLDPLFHRTSALFDQGGAQGLLVNNLTAWAGCEILFDSSHCPEQLVVNAPITRPVQVPVPDVAWRFEPGMAAGEVTPSLHLLLDMCEGTREDQAAWQDLRLEPEAAGPGPYSSPVAPQDAANADLGGPDAAACSPASNSCPTADDDLNNAQADLPDADDDLGVFGCDDFGDDDGNNIGLDSLGDDLDAEPAPADDLWVADLMLAQQQSTKGWAGPAAWRPVTVKQRRAANQLARKAPGKRMAPAMLDIAGKTDEDLEEMLAAMPQVPVKKRTYARSHVPLRGLPDDTGFKVSRLFVYSLCPSLELSSEDRPAARSRPEADVQGGYEGSSWEGGVSDDYDGGFDPDQACPGDGADEEEDDLQLMAAPREVARLTVQYSSMQKQVDIRALKENLWGSLQVATTATRDAVPFQDVIAKMPESSAAGRLEDISVHLCFISLLHLANEHGLQLQGSRSDRLRIEAAA